MSGSGGMLDGIVPPLSSLPDEPIAVVPAPGPILPATPLVSTGTALSAGTLSGVSGGEASPIDPLIEWLDGLIGPGGTGPTFPIPPG